jgi:hypothetical protein
MPVLYSTVPEAAIMRLMTGALPECVSH